MKLKIPFISEKDDTLLESSSWSLFPQYSCIPHAQNSLFYETRFQIAYSANGIYLRMECDDTKITSTYLQDNLDMYNGDVVEVFFWPDQSQNIYFEYEVSALGVELPLLVSNSGGTFMGWLPWHYENERKIQKKVLVQGGDQQPNATITGWEVNCFIPFALFKGLGNTPPLSGTIWKGNFFRMDYDEDSMVNKWEWDTLTQGEFHNFKDLGELEFE